MTRNRRNAPSGSAANPYPRTVRESIDDSMRFKRATVEAVKAFANAKPWRGNVAVRLNKMREAARALAAAYGTTTPTIKATRGADCYSPSERTIYLNTSDGGPSVITFLHEFAHHLGRDERGACRWSLNLFKRNFPRSFARLVPDGHTLRRRRPLIERRVLRNADGSPVRRRRRRRNRTEDLL